LQGIVSFDVFYEFRWRSGIWPQARLSNAPTAVFPIPAPSGAEPGPTTGAVLDLLAARVTGQNTLARGRALIYFLHVEIPFAGAVQQTPAGIFHAGAGQIGCE
jgi:hypothetical protein